MSEPYRIEGLPRKADRKGFTCGVAALDAYFHSRVGQEIDKRYCACFVTLDNSDDSIAGYYTLSPSAVAVEEVPEEVRRKLPRYDKVPCTLMGRLAVAKTHQGKGLGEVLLFDALARASNSALGGFAMYVRAKDEKAKAFYVKYGFVQLSDDLDLFLALKGVPRI
jgi:predicted GNAT family N-acyltransferase